MIHDSYDFQNSRSIEKQWTSRTERVRCKPWPVLQKNTFKMYLNSNNFKKLIKCFTNTFFID